MSGKKPEDGRSTKKESTNDLPEPSQEAFFSAESSVASYLSVETVVNPTPKASILSRITQYFTPKASSTKTLPSTIRERPPGDGIPTDDDIPTTSRDAAARRLTNTSSFEVPIARVTYVPPDSVSTEETAMPVLNADEMEEPTADQGLMQELDKQIDFLPAQPTEPPIEPLPVTDSLVTLRPLEGDSSTVRKKKILAKAKRDFEEKKQKYNLGSSFFGLTTAPSEDTHTQHRPQDYKISPAKSDKSLEYGNAFIYMLIPPDGGYGWVIVLVSFISQMIVDGIVLALGIVLPFIAEDLGINIQSVVLVVSVQLGPFASAALNKYGFRPVALFGAVVAIAVTLASSFSPNLPTLLILYSLIGGPACSMIWVCSQLIIGFYFERYRPIANGLSCSGAGLGLFVFAFLNDYLCREITWRNTFRVYALLIAVVFAMSWVYVQVAPTLIGRMLHTEADTDTEDNDVLEYFREYNYTQTQNLTFEKELEDRLVEYNEEDHQRGCCQRLCPRCYRTESLVDMGAKRYVLRTDPIERQDLYYTGPAHYDEEANDSKDPRTPVDSKSAQLDDRRVQTVQHTLSNMSIHSQKKKRRFRKKSTYSYFNPKRYLPQKMTHAFQVLFDFSLLQRMEFRILLLSAFFFPLGFAIPFMFSKVRTGIHDDFKLYITPIIGLSNFVFRIICGFIAYKYKQNVPMVCGLGLILGGLIVFISAFYGLHIPWFQYVYAAIYGIAPAAYSTLRAIIYVRYLGLENLTGAFGLTAVAMGVGVFLGTSLAALLNRLTGGYTTSFVCSGFCLIMSGMLKIILPYLIIWKEHREARKRRVSFE